MHSIIRKYVYEEQSSKLSKWLVNLKFNVFSSIQRLRKWHIQKRICSEVIFMYENIDHIFPNKLHGPMCIQWTHVLYSVVITRQSNSPISQFNSLCNEFTSVWTMFVYNTLSYSLQRLNKLGATAHVITILSARVKRRNPKDYTEK